MKTWLIATLTLAAALGATAQTADPLKAAVAADNRLVGNVARDAARHPYETLSFFGVKPTDTVVELAPGGGWYTEILAPYLRESGQLYAAEGQCFVLASCAVVSNEMIEMMCDTPSKRELLKAGGGHARELVLRPHGDAQSPSVTP